MKRLLLLCLTALCALSLPAQGSGDPAPADSMDVRFTVTDEKGHPAEGFYTSLNWYDENGQLIGQNTGLLTDAAGETVVRAPRGQALYQWIVRDKWEHYYQLYAMASEAQLAKGVDASYEGMHRVDISATGKLADMYYENFGMVFFNATWTPESGKYSTNGSYNFVPLCEYDDAGGKGYVVCPDGILNILCFPTMEDGITNYAVRSINVCGRDTAVSCDLTEAYPVTATTSNASEGYGATVYLTAKAEGHRLMLHDDGRFAPGEYLLYAYTYIPSGNQYVELDYTETVEVTDGPLAFDIDMSPERFHTWTYDESGGPEGITVAASLVDREAGITLYASGFSNYTAKFQDGTHHYSVVQLRDEVQNAYHCFPIEGEVTLAGTDAVVPVDLSGLVCNRLDLHLSYEPFFGYFDGHYYWGSEVVDADGERMQLTGFSQPLGVALAPGDYTLEVLVSPGRLLTTDFTVEEGSDGSLISAELTEQTAGIAGMTAGALSARVTPAGIAVTSPGGQAQATVYDLSGRTVLSATAADGETIGTTRLPAGTYMLYLRQGRHATTLKFMK